MRRLLIGGISLLVVVAIVIVLLFVPGPFNGNWRFWQQPDTNLKVSAGESNLTFATKPFAVTADMQSALPAGSVINNPQEITPSASVTASSNVVLTYSLKEPIDATHTGNIAYWNSDASQWEPVPTNVSTDRMTLSGSVPHLSPWAWILSSLTDAASFTYNGIGQITGTKTTKPTCDSTKPSWASPKYLDDINAMVLWCYQSASNDPNTLEVKVKLNRNYIGIIQTGIEPTSASSGLFGSNVPSLGSILSWASLPPNSLGADGYLIEPLGEYDFTFTEDQLRSFYQSGDAPLITVNTDSSLVMEGQLYGVLKDAAGNKGAMIGAVLSIAECAKTVKDAVTDQDIFSAMGLLHG